MRTTFLTVFLITAFFSFSGVMDSTLYYKARISGIEKHYRDQEMQLKYEYEKKEAALKLELEEKDILYKTRIEKLQTMLIASCVSSVFVIGFCFYVLNKKKSQGKKP